MDQRFLQTQTQGQKQTQRLTRQQMLAVRLLEMPLAQLEQSVATELYDNPALEAGDGEEPRLVGDDGPGDDGSDFDGDGDTEATRESEDRADALADALAGIGMDDDMPPTSGAVTSGGGEAEREGMNYGDPISFHDKLREQMIDVDLTPTDREVMDYLIGSLDDDGLLRKDSGTLADELAIYHSIDVSADDVERVLAKLREFDPAGIGARDLRECLLIQIRRKEPSERRELMERVIMECLDELKNKRWDKIAARLKIDADKAERVRSELLRLNPKPGSSLGETDGSWVEQITPDFIVETTDDGNVTFSINGGDVPELYVSPTYAEQLQRYKTSRETMSKRDKEAFVNIREKVERARGFIEAVRQRQHTLNVTMKAIVEIQKSFFLDGDEADIKPMRLKDVAERTGLDISTVSRVSNMKYAQTQWGTFKLRHFFSDSLRTDDGEALSTRKVKTALKEAIDGEDKRRPLSDSALEKIMNEKGYPVARRTIAKYREQLGVPVARLRKI